MIKHFRKTSKFPGQHLKSSDIEQEYVEIKQEVNEL